MAVYQFKVVLKRQRPHERQTQWDAILQVSEVIFKSCNKLVNYQPQTFKFVTLDSVSFYYNEEKVDELKFLDTVAGACPINSVSRPIVVS